MARGQTGRPLSASLPEPFIPLPRVVHEGEGYRLELELSPDPSRDTIVIAFRLTGEDMALYVLLAPHLDGSGWHNNARADGDLQAWRDCNALHLASDCGFSRTSAGYVGHSDGWQDFSRNGTMRWTFSEALDGNVALMGELASPEGVLALAFADTPEGARTLAYSSLCQGFETMRHSFSRPMGGMGEGPDHSRRAGGDPAGGLPLRDGSKGSRGAYLSRRGGRKPERAVGQYHRQSRRLSSGMDAGRRRGWPRSSLCRSDRRRKANARLCDGDAAAGWRMEPEWLPRWASVLDRGPTRRGRFPDPSRGKASKNMPRSTGWAASLR